MSSSLATAQDLRKVDLRGMHGSDINFLQSCLSSLSHSQSLQELVIDSSAPSECSVLGTHVNMLTYTLVHASHTVCAHVCAYVQGK